MDLISDEYKIAGKKIEFNEAKIALNEGRPVLASFDLTVKQWDNFRKFYKAN